MSTLHLSRFVIAGLVVAGTAAASLGVAEARTFTREEFINRDKCFEVVRMPAIVEVNTRGVHVSGASTSVVGNTQVDGSVVTIVHNDPVFIQTTRIVDDQHVTLVPISC